MSFIERVFASRTLYINGTLASGEDLARFAADYTKKKISVVSQTQIINGGQAERLYIKTN